MAEATPSKTSASEDATRGMPYHDACVAELKKLLTKKKAVDQELLDLDAQLEQAETAYLENNPNGNILVGFENYIKGASSSALGGRRKLNVGEHDRVFSRLMGRGLYDLDSPAPSSAQSTPGHATPVSASFKADGGAGKAAVVAGKKGPKKSVHEDSGDEGRDGKKRIHFGAAGRK